MAKKRRVLKGEIYFPTIVGIHLLLWSIDLFLYEGSITLSEGENPVQRVLGEIMSSWVITVFGFNLLMVTRARWVEKIFGGLDKMYLIHRRSGTIAMLLLFLHFAIVPRHPEFTIGKPLGFIAMLLIFLGVLFSVAPFFKRRISYHKWLSIHRLMGPFYIIGVCHAYLVPTLISQLPLVRTYVFGMSFVGVISWVYRVFFHKKVHPKVAYKIKELQSFGGSLLVMKFKPVNSSIDFLPGQFAFFNFPRINPKESHPFTVDSHPDEGYLRIAVKASGDFTEFIQKKAKIDDLVQVEGPYGHFTQKSCSSNNQVWIAGGIGITPFLSLARDLEGLESEVSLYWTVANKEAACFDEELRNLAKQLPNLKYRLWVSNDEGRLKAETIIEKKKTEDLHVFICGPEALRDSLEDQFHTLGVSKRNIHSEEFSFR